MLPADRALAVIFTLYAVDKHAAWHSEKDHTPSHAREQLLGELRKAASENKTAGVEAPGRPDPTTWGKQASLEDLPPDVLAKLPADVRASLESR